MPDLHSTASLSSHRKAPNTSRLSVRRPLAPELAARFCTTVLSFELPAFKLTLKVVRFRIDEKPKGQGTVTRYYFRKRQLCRTIGQSAGQLLAVFADQ